VAVVLGRDAVYDLGVLCGRAWAEGRTFLSLTSGVGLVVTEECPGLFAGGSCRNRHALGLPVSVSLRQAHPFLRHRLAISALPSRGHTALTLLAPHLP
jgi:hypothetical protein